MQAAAGWADSSIAPAREWAAAILRQTSLPLVSSDGVQCDPVGAGSGAGRARRAGTEMMATQTQRYRPYRSSLLSSDQLRDLNRLRPARAVCDTLVLWLQIIVAWATVALWPSWWVVALAIPVI